MSERNLIGFLPGPARSKVKFLTVPDRKPFWIWTCVISGHVCSHWTCVERGLGTGSAPPPDDPPLDEPWSAIVDCGWAGTGGACGWRVVGLCCVGCGADVAWCHRRTKRITTSDHENNIVLSPLAPPRSRQANRGPRQSTCLCLKYRTVLTVILH